MSRHFYNLEGIKISPFPSRRVCEKSKTGVYCSRSIVSCIYTFAGNGQSPPARSAESGECTPSHHERNNGGKKDESSGVQTNGS